MLRRVEIALWVVGISLLGVALGATLHRWHHQTQQERAILARMDAVSGVLKAAPAPKPKPAKSDRGTSAFIGPPAPERPAVAARTGDLPMAAPPAPAQSAPTPPRLVKAKNATEERSAYGLIEIPRIGVRAIVEEGADDRTLARAVGLVPQGARPGEAGNIVLAGHRDTFFRPLRNIELNDRIRVIVPPEEYEYRVDEIRVVTPEETSVLESRGVEELTLVTCFPFRFVGPSPDRFIVSASRVN